MPGYKNDHAQYLSHNSFRVQDDFSALHDCTLAFDLVVFSFMATMGTMAPSTRTGISMVTGSMCGFRLCHLVTRVHPPVVRICGWCHYVVAILICSRLRMTLLLFGDILLPPFPPLSSSGGNTAAAKAAGEYHHYDDHDGDNRAARSRHWRILVTQAPRVVTGISSIQIDTDNVRHALNDW